jgi:hypothetical protein
VDHLHSRGITHVLNLGEADPLGVAPIIDPQTLPGEQPSTVKYSATFRNFFKLKKFKPSTTIKQTKTLKPTI